MHTVIGVDLYDICLDGQRSGPANQTAKFSIWRAEVDGSTGEARISGNRSVLHQVYSYPTYKALTDGLEQVFRN